jgi:NAD(P)-dependent dehydrogenase (short-subunit alcohol dehydrogenase family)
VVPFADNTSGGFIAYRSSKAAVNMVMRSAAIDLAPRGITCVLLNPGWVRTDMGGKGAIITAGECDCHAGAHRDCGWRSHRKNF